MSRQITVQTQLAVDPAKAWEVYTTPDHVTQWNAASEDWHCPEARTDLRPGGQFCYRMASRDGNMAFDFEGTWLRVDRPSRLDYDIGGRSVTVLFTPVESGTHVAVSFDPEDENPIDAQCAGWQAILDNYKAYAERV